ncbi:MAG TPA: hypothetical protein VI541_04545, partial [Actinomycetota bacterium]|nr:hypothetical protein [Actinomycetota bacterium]
MPTWLLSLKVASSPTARRSKNASSSSLSLLILFTTLSNPSRASAEGTLLVNVIVGVVMGDYGPIQAADVYVTLLGSAVQ